MHARSVLGVTVHDVTYEEALDAICRFVEEGGPHFISTPNPEFVMSARRNPVFRQVLNRAALAIPDGVGLLWAGRLAGCPFREHVRGTDLVLRLARRSAERGHRWFFLGGAPGVADRAARAIQRHAPGLAVAGALAGRSSPAGDEEARAAIRAVGPVDVVLVAFGAPRQELWMDRNLAAVDVPVGIGVGGVFNYLAGEAPRAPVLMRRLELEWLHRLATQPWRWRRQLALPAFVLATLAAQYLPNGGGAVRRVS